MLGGEGVRGFQGAGCCVFSVFRVLSVKGVQGAGCWVISVFMVLGVLVFRVLGAGC